MHIALLMVLFGRFCLGLFWEGKFPQQHQVLHVHLLSCADIALLLHGVLVKFQQSICGAAGVQTFCVNKESLS